MSADFDTTMENDSICAFDATIDTTVDMATGEIQKKYDFDRLA